MNRYLFIGLLLLTACSKEDKQPLKANPLSPVLPLPLLVVAAGQSNMSGDYSGGVFPLDSLVTSVTGNRAGRGYEFAVLLAHNLNRPIVFLNCAVQGSSMDEWAPGGQNYSRCVSKARATGLEASYFLFSQGETDAGYQQTNPVGSGYHPMSDWANNFSYLITSLRSSLGSNFKVIYTQIGQFNASPLPENYQYIKDEQDRARAIVPFSSMVKTDDLTPNCGGGWHYCQAEEAIIGQRLWEEK